MSGRPSVYIGETLAMGTVRNSNSYWIRILPPTGVLSIDRLRPSRIYAVAYTIERDTMHFWSKVMKLVCTRCTLLKFGENNSSLVEIIDIFRYPRRWPQLAISNFFKMCTSDTTDRYKLVPGVLCKQLVRIVSSLWKLLTFFDIRMAAAAIFDFEHWAFLPMGSTAVGVKCTLVKFSKNCFFRAEIIHILVNPRWRRPPSWILKIMHLWPMRSTTVGTRCKLVKFG